MSSFHGNGNNASVQWGDAEIRVYYQDNNNNIRERMYSNDGGWQHGNGNNPLSSAQPGTSISAITWDSGNQRQIRVYFVDTNNRMVEWAYTRNGWGRGGFSL